MSRIIGGSVGGRRIKTPAGRGTRPTSDRVREALFSALEANHGSITGLRFLDLFAGSGAVGLEARSRGAGVVTMVEQDRRAAAVVHANAAELGLRRVEVVTAPVARVVAQPPRAPYDLVFLDPPYALGSGEVSEVLRDLCDQGWLAHQATVVVERGARADDLTWPSALVPERSRRYGETTLWYGRAADQTR